MACKHFYASTCGPALGSRAIEIVLGRPQAALGLTRARSLLLWFMRNARHLNGLTLDLPAASDCSLAEDREHAGIVSS